MGLTQVNRLERSRRFVLHSSRPLTEAEKARFAGLVHDRMTEEVYRAPVRSFTEGLQAPAPTFTIPLMAEGRAALEKINKVRRGRGREGGRRVCGIGVCGIGVCVGWGWGWGC